MKRIADRQIQREDGDDPHSISAEDGGGEDVPTTPHEHKPRVIRGLPKRKGGTPIASPGTAAGANPFALLAQPNVSAPASEQSKTSLFANVQLKPASPTAKPSAPPTSAFPAAPAAATAASAAPRHTHEYWKGVRGLNWSLTRQLVNVLSQSDELANLHDTLVKFAHTYERYHDELAAKWLGVHKMNPSSASQDTNAPAAPTTTSFSFTKPAQSAPVPPKPDAPTPADSFGGPQEKSLGTGVKPPLLTFAPKQDVNTTQGALSTPKPQATPGFSFGQHKEPAEKQGFTFAQSSEKDDMGLGSGLKGDKQSASGFVFGAKDEKPNTNGFSFGAKETVKSSTPGFSFGTKESDKVSKGFLSASQEKNTGTDSFAFAAKKSDKPGGFVFAGTKENDKHTNFGFAPRASEKPSVSGFSFHASDSPSVTAFDAGNKSSASAFSTNTGGFAFNSGSTAASSLPHGKTALSQSEQLSNDETKSSTDQGSFMQPQNDKTSASKGGLNEESESNKDIDANTGGEVNEEHKGDKLDKPVPPSLPSTGFSFAGKSTKTFLSGAAPKPFTGPAPPQFQMPAGGFSFGKLAANEKLAKDKPLEPSEQVDKPADEAHVTEVSAKEPGSNDSAPSTPSKPTVTTNKSITFGSASSAQTSGSPSAPHRFSFGTSPPLSSNSTSPSFTKSAIGPSFANTTGVAAGGSFKFGAAPIAFGSPENENEDDISTQSKDDADAPKSRE